MKPLKHFAVFAILLLQLSACIPEGKCWKAACSDEITFQLVDKATQQDLVFGINPRYKLDSMELKKKNDFRLGRDENYLSSIVGSSHALYAPARAEYADTSYLRLTHLDIDTLVISYIRESNECCIQYGGYGKIVAIKYNGKVAAKSGDIFKFEKE